MDLQMPEMDGIAATAAIRQEWSDARIVVLTTYKGDAQALRALKAGASGYLLNSVVRTRALGSYPVGAYRGALANRRDLEVAESLGRK